MRGGYWIYNQADTWVVLGGKMRVRSLVIAALVGLGLWVLSNRSKEAKAAAIAPKVISDMLAQGIIITPDTAKDAADKIAAEIGVSPEDPAPAEAVYNVTGIVPTGHWGPPSTDLKNRYPRAWNFGFVDGQVGKGMSAEAARDLEGVSRDEIKAYQEGYQAGISA